MKSAPEKPAAPRRKRTNGTHGDDLPSVQLDHAVIARRAWEIWQNEGCPAGREVEHWLQAEKELAATLSL